MVFVDVKLAVGVAESVSIQQRITNQMHVLRTSKIWEMWLNALVILEACWRRGGLALRLSIMCIDRLGTLEKNRQLRPLARDGVVCGRWWLGATFGIGQGGACCANFPMGRCSRLPWRHYSFFGGLSAICSYTFFTLI